MGGILSPDGESVLHESKWIEAILSPDGSMYFHEGDWYGLAEEITSAIPVVEKSPPKQPEVREVEIIRSNDNGTETGKILAAIFAIFLLWFVFDSGSIISYADLATMDCSIWADDSEFFDFSEFQEDCEETKSAAALIVGGGCIGVIFCLGVIFSSSNSNPKSRVTLEGTPRPLNQSRIDAERRVQRQNVEHLELLKELKRCKTEASFLRKRITLCIALESAKEELATARSNWHASQDEWEPLYSKIEEKRALFGKITVAIIILGFLISFAFYAIISTIYGEAPEKALGDIFPYIIYYSWAAPLAVFIIMRSNRIVDKENPLLILRDSIPELERQIEHDRRDLGSLDAMHGSPRDVVTLSIDGMEELLEEREAFIMGKRKGRGIQ